MNPTLAEKFASGRRWRGILKPSVRCGILVIAVTAAGCAARTAGDPPLFTDDFEHGLRQWVVEQQPGGTVTAHEGRLVIKDRGGCTVWFRAPLEAPVVIRYEATISSASRVSDLNCFWMASDPANPGDIFAARPVRDGRFSTYDRLKAYYVGYGGNENTTTRFRRYDGTGARPLDPRHDLRAAEFLLRPDHEYHLALVATREGLVQFIRDGQVVFEVRDPAPFTRGWFGFRTLHSEMELRHFRVERPSGEK